MRLKLVESDYNSLNKEIQDTVYDAFEGTDFMISGVELMDDGKIVFDVSAAGPDGMMDREAEIRVPEINYLDAVRNACEDWMIEHGSPDSFYDSENIKESFSPQGYTKVIRAINDGIETDEDTEELRKYLQNIVSYCKGIADDYNLTLTLEETLDETLDETSVEEYKGKNAIDTDKLLKKLHTIQNDISNLLGPIHKQADVTLIVKQLRDTIDKAEDAKKSDSLLEDECETSEATQPKDIAKKEEYRKMVRPDFKVGSKI